MSMKVLYSGHAPILNKNYNVYGILHEKFFTFFVNTSTASE